jgi:GH15 family glucan-1,4-alpha-glucosidase
VAERPVRTDGYAPIADYAALGNGRTAALVALDGTVDWLPLPAFDSPPVFGALLDARRGGLFDLRPTGPYTAERRYVPDTNILETTFRTADGAVRVTDGLIVRDGAPTVTTRLVRLVDPLSGEVPMRWSIEPRFDWGTSAPERRRHGDATVIRSGRLALTVQSWDAGEVEPDRSGAGDVSGEFVSRAGRRALISLAGFHAAPLVIESRDEIEEHLGETVDYWRRVASLCHYQGPWREAVVRSALALRLLVHEPSGAITAAPTTSLPEAVGGSRNYDYRYGWIRDTCFTLEAMLTLGYTEQVHASLSWLLRASRRTHPRLSVFYHLDSSPPTGPVEIDQEGYRGSRPVLEGNGAAGQLQLGTYGDLMQTAWLFVEEGHALDPDAGQRLAEVADFVTHVWTRPDSGIWELPERRDYTQGKLSAWLALERAVRLAGAGQVPGDHVAHWRRVAAQVREYLDHRCWSTARNAFASTAGGQDLDTSVLLAARVGYLDGSDPRLASTVDALRGELGRGALMYRYSGMEHQEGAFLACSFWLVEALVTLGRVDEAAELMDELVGRVNDVGLLSEEIDPDSGEMLGNFPQALSHLALVNAASAVAEAAGPVSGSPGLRRPAAVR